MRGSAAFRAAVAPGGVLAGPWVRNELWRRARAVPSLDLRFAENKSLVDATTGSNLVTFTRASSGTYVDSQGVIRSAVANLLLQSEDFSTNWIASRSSVSSNVVTAPDGALTGDKLVANNGEATPVLQYNATVSDNTVYTFSVFAKQGEWDSIRLRFIIKSGSDLSIRYDFSTDEIYTSSGSVQFSRQKFNDGWVRLRFSGDVASGGTAPALQIFAGDGRNFTVVGDGTSGIYLWGAQLEQSSTVGEYIPTTSVINSAPRFDHNPVTGESLGLLVEEQRTNSIRNNTMVGAVAGTPGTVPTNWNVTTANVGISREIIGTGTENGITYIDIKYSGTTTGSGVINITPDDGVTASSGQAWTSSAYVTLVGGSLANLTLTHRIRQAVSGGGFLGATDQTLSPVSGNLINNRYSVTLSSAPATIATLGQYFILSFAASGLVIDITLRIGLPQLEQGAFATSVIPTSTATVTRNADVASISGNAFSSWYRQDEGTILYDQTVFSYPPATNASFYAFSDGTGDNRISGFVPSGSNHRLRIDESGSNTYIANAVLTADVLSPARVALGFKTNDVNCAYNGTLRSKDESATIPLVDRLNFGEFNAAVDLSTRIKRLIFWPQRLSNSTLANITQ